MALAAPVAAQNDPVPTPGIALDDPATMCTAGFAADDAAGNRYLMTSGHCDSHDGALWTYSDGLPLGRITASEEEGELRDAAIIRLEPQVPTPDGSPNGIYPVRDVLSAGQLSVGMPFCKTGAVTGETCGAITSVDGDVIETSVYSLEGDSGSPGYVKNPDGTISAVGLLMSSPEDDDAITYFVLVDPLLDQWGLRILG
nr:S1 family peptidase [Mycolicibacterium sp. S2-37]